MIFLNPSSSHPNPSLTDPLETCKAIVFPVAGQWFALPQAAILRVIQTPFPFQPEVPHWEIVYQDNQPLTLVNLHYTLAQAQLRTATTPSATAPGRFLIIAHTGEPICYGIPVDAPPSLMELPLTSIHPLPVAHRQALRNIAEHMAVLPDPKGTLTLWLLNLQHLH